MNTQLSTEKIGRRIIDNLLSRKEFMYYHVEDVQAIHYAEACAGFGALRLAGLLKDSDLIEKITSRYSIELSLTLEEGKEINTANHVDVNVYGILPLEIYIQTGNKKYLDQGLYLADKQWENPLANGMSNQTRYWVDDIYMISSLQGQAFNATKNEIYIERTALEIDSYLKKLQQPNGCFFHGENAQFFWGRGNGWVAAGLVELLSRVSKENKFYNNIKSGYLKMMNALKSYQCEDGMWRQLIDNENSWKETSGSAMFGYAVCAGVKKGILPKSDFELVYKKAWQALKEYVLENGDLKDICPGTGQSTSVDYYLNRPKVAGDLHGQAAMLWFCYEMLSDSLI